MKFSDFTVADWKENGRFFDTCLLPYTGLTGSEHPAEAAEVLERLRDFMDLIEKPYQGRIVTYPAIQYQTAESTAYVNDICRKVKSKQFQFAVVVTGEVRVSAELIHESDLVLSLPELEGLSKSELSVHIKQKIERMWQSDK
ncbi:DUF2487 domain-containing protein [Paenibacillus sp. PK3_47]|uniref:DUF2487 family protein n=1 Tax=Paenibacillus sp. PK3_47 TaxID=2072642 RepID=UPI00201DB9AB|nr:DUF2487 family protein [Paenibacillus sp. PK3_47]UQZ32389.1 DUF2487 domain-containing protein [Paenibacillus sp. PK3_47]